MGFTRASVEAVAMGDVGALFAFVGKDTTTAGSNPDLNGPLAFALNALSLPVADPSSVSDADLSTLDNSQFGPVGQLTAYFAIRQGLNSFVAPNEMAQDRRQDWNDMARRFQAQLASIERQYPALTQLRPAPVVSGVYPNRFPTPRDPHRFAIGCHRVDH